MEKCRESFVKEVLSGEHSKSWLCREYGISRPTGDKWLKRYLSGQSLCDQSRAPFHSPNRTKPDVEQMVLEEREKHPAWGARKIRRVLERRGLSDLPAASTVNQMIKRAGMITHEASVKATPYKRFERAQPNELWQTDFKGHFLLGDGTRCHPLTVLDDHSRFSLGLDAMDNERRDSVVSSFERIFKAYGMPLALLCDNGNPWSPKHAIGFCTFEIWLMNHDILPIHGRVRHPQTQGKEERFHKTLIDELISRTHMDHLQDAQRHFDAFREEYNHLRPHHALNLDVPAQHYRKSDRIWRDRVEPWDYGNNYITARVSADGAFRYRKREYLLSKAFPGHVVALLESDEPGMLDVFYRNFRIARYDILSRDCLTVKIRRLANLL